MTTRVGLSAAPLTTAEIDRLFDRILRPVGNTSPLLLAVSGGPDSTALMGVLAGWTARVSGPLLAVATVDHGLRPGSRAEAEGVGVQAAALGLTHVVLTWDRHSGTSRSQEAARLARYALLMKRAVEIGARQVVTAHTADDQAETVLMRLAAGSGPAGLGGMRERVAMPDGIDLLRPFLSVSKARFVATCQEHGWSFAVDRSNDDPRYARPRWRALAAMLAAEGLSPNRLRRLAERERRADEALGVWAEAAAARLVNRGESGPNLAFRDLLTEPEEIGLRVLARVLALDDGATGTQNVRLERLERTYATLRRASATGQPARLTLAHRLLTLDRHGRLQIQPEPKRQRGRNPSAADAPQSLGKDVGIVHLA